MKRLLVSGLSVLALFLSSIQPVSADQAKVQLVGLGDSYSTGQGLPGTSPDCLRNSAEAFPAQLAATLQLTADLQACAGATAETIQATQLEALSSQTRVVTLTAGGNDVKIFDFIAKCISEDCSGEALETALHRIATEMPRSLTQLYKEIGKRVPANARVLVGGYPLLMTPLPTPQVNSWCSAFSPQERVAGSFVALWLNHYIAKAVRGLNDPRFTFVSALSQDFLGNELCGTRPAYFFDQNGASPFHPNELGIKAYVAAFGRAL